MIINTLLEQSGDTKRIADFYEALKTIHGMKVESLQGGNWMDDLYDCDYSSTDKLSYRESGLDDLDENDLGPEDKPQDDESWMDDLDEAA
jgi:hypothetical protein